MNKQAALEIVEGETIEIDKEQHQEFESESRLLRVGLTQDELLERGDELAKLERGRAAMETNHKAQRSEMRTAMKGEQERIGTKAYDVENRSEERDVDCVWYGDFSLDKRFLVRPDTGEVISVKDMTDADRQQSLV